MPLNYAQDSVSLGAKLNQLVQQKLRVWKRILLIESQRYSQIEKKTSLDFKDDIKKGNCADYTMRSIDRSGVEYSPEEESLMQSPQKGDKKRHQSIVVSGLVILLLISFTISVKITKGKSFWLEPRNTVEAKHQDDTLSPGRGPFSFKRFFEHKIITLTDTENSSPNHIASNQGIEVAFPYTPNPEYGSPAYTTLLVNHTFGNSWGQPSLVTFSPPEGVSFNKVVLRLHTSVDHVQYDRLAHIFVGGAEVWRTSTIEPSGKLRFSKFAKDVSIYESLFKTKNQLLFQLDNIVTDSLKGAFNIELYADFYSADSNILAGDDDTSVEDTLTLGPTEKYTILSTVNGPSKVHPLVPQSNPSDAPTESLPSKTFSFSLPRFSTNTTRLRLAIFTSGNGNEEFWYTNVLDKYTDIFGGGLLGHGPARFINVYFNDQKILSQTPHPVIFTGGIAPTLWNPVSNNAFDLKSNDLDISGLLPELWNTATNDSTAIKNNTIRIEISNAIDEFQGGNSGVGNDWITSANLLAYESENVIDASGELSHIGHRNRGNVVGIAPPYTGTLHQIVNAILSAELTSSLSFKLKDGSVLNTTFSYHTKGEISNIQSYGQSGDIENVVHVGHSVKSLLIVDNDLSKTDDGFSNSAVGTILQLNASLSYPFTLHGKSKEYTDNSTLDVALVNVKETEVNVDDESIFTANVRQNGTAHFVFSNKGNRGSGGLHVEYGLRTNEPLEGQGTYKRVVDGKNLIIVSDSETSAEDNDTNANVIDLKDPSSFADTLNYILDSFPNGYTQQVNGTLQNESFSELGDDLSSNQVNKLVRRLIDGLHSM